MKLVTLSLLTCVVLALAQAPPQKSPSTPAQPRSTAGEIYRQSAQSVVAIDAYDDKGQVGWKGTGFIVSADGKILTNYHVIRNSKQATVRLADGDAYDTVEVMDVDRRKDIALLKIKAVDLKPLRIGDSNASQIGDPVYSLSNALGLDNSLSEGLISGSRQMDGYRLMQITAPISHGSSGGPLFNANGEVIGITALSLPDAQSLNFAIPINYARGILASPSAPRSLAAVYDPEEPAPEPAKPSQPPATSTTASAAPAPAPPASGTLAPAPSKVPDELRQSGIVPFIEKRLHVWAEQDAQNVLGDPISHRYGYDNFHNITSDINTYPDPTLAMQKVELGFDTKTKRLNNIYFYPVRLSWEQCRKLWGDNFTVMKNPAVNDGSKFYMYKDRRLNVLLDRHNDVISLGIY